MRPYRNLKVGNLIEHELTRMILKECDIEGALVTITNVEVSEDLLQAVIKIGIIPYEKEIEVYYELEKKRRSLEHDLFKKINIRPMPHLKFVIDSHKKEED